MYAAYVDLKLNLLDRYYNEKTLDQC